MLLTACRVECNWLSRGTDYIVRQKPKTEGPIRSEAGIVDSRLRSAALIRFVLPEKGCEAGSQGVDTYFPHKQFKITMVCKWLIINGFITSVLVQCCICWSKIWHSAQSNRIFAPATPQMLRPTRLPKVPPATCPNTIRTPLCCLTTLSTTTAITNLRCHV